MAPTVLLHEDDADLLVCLPQRVPLLLPVRSLGRSREHPGLSPKCALPCLLPLLLLQRYAMDSYVAHVSEQAGRTSIVFTLREKPGALAETLRVFQASLLLQFPVRVAWNNSFMGVTALSPKQSLARVLEGLLTAFDLRFQKEGTEKEA